MVSTSTLPIHRAGYAASTSGSSSIETFSRKGQCLRLFEIGFEVRHPRAAARSGEPQHGAHRKFRLMNRLRIDDGPEHVDRGLMNPGGDAADLLRLQRLPLHDLQQSVGRRMRMPAGSVEFERRLDERPALAQPVDEALGIRVTRHPRGHGLGAGEDAFGAGETVAREVGGGKTCGRGMGRVERLRIGSVP